MAIELIKNIEADSKLSDEVKTVLKDLVNSFFRDTQVDYKECLKKLACYMRGDDKKHEERLKHEKKVRFHRNSDFTNHIRNHVRALHKLLKEGTYKKEARNIKIWLWRHMGKLMRYKNVKSKECNGLADTGFAKLKY